MNDKPLVSVHMLTYNHGPYIRRAMDSVLSQITDFPFELLIGEDCSTDETREIVLNYQTRHPQLVRVLTSAHNVGMHKNAIRLQEATRGEFVAFCEGDDYWHDPTKLQTQIGFLMSNSDYGMVHCNYDTYDVSKGRLRRHVINCPSALKDDNAYEEFLLRTRTVMTLTVCVRRNLLDRVLKENSECTDEQWPMGDTQRWLEICRVTKVKYFPRSMATHNYLMESASQSADPNKAFQFTERAGELILHYLTKYPIEDALDKQVRRWVGLAVTKSAFLAGDSDKVASWLNHSQLTVAPMPVEALLYLLVARRSWVHCLARPTLRMLWTCRKLRNALFTIIASNRGETIQ